MAMIREQIPIHKKWLWIKSNIPFTIETNYNDSIEKAPGTWKINTWELLPEKYHKNNPVFMLYISYDKEAHPDVYNPYCIYSLTDIELSAIDSGETFGASDLDTTNDLIDNVKDSVDFVNTSVGLVKDSVDSVNTSVGLVKDSVDSVNTSVGLVKDSVDSVKNKIIGIKKIFNKCGKWTNYGTLLNTQGVMSETQTKSVLNKFIRDCLNISDDDITPNSNVDYRLKVTNILNGFYNSDIILINNGKILKLPPEYYSGSGDLDSAVLYIKCTYHKNASMATISKPKLLIKENSVYTEIDIGSNAQSFWTSINSFTLELC